MGKRALGSLLICSAVGIAINIPSRGVPLLIRVLLLFGFVFSFSTSLNAQPASDAANSPEHVQSRIQRARALIAAHQLETAASELESVRASTQDFATRNITSVMLMSIYLEAGNYTRAEALLEESFRSRAVQNGDSVRTYFALAGQAVNGTRSHLARYRTFGINTTDTSLPAEAVSDLERLRSFLERMIAQAKEISDERKAYDSLSLLEDVLGIRLSLARDMDDQNRWQTKYASARELLASQTQIASLDAVSVLPPGKQSLTKVSSPSPYSTRRLPEATEAAQNDEPVKPQPMQSASDNNIGAQQSLPSSDVPVSDAGSLNAKATKRVVPAYPDLAKQAGAVGLVRVHVIVDENGKVVKVSHSEGPVLLRQVAEDAARQWFFETSSSESPPTRLSGYIDFNFTL
jgi:TonB family protein